MNRFRHDLTVFLLLVSALIFSSCGGETAGGAGRTNSSNDVAYAVATDARGNVYVAGYTDGSFEGNPSAGNADLLLIKYDSGGFRQWARQLGTGWVDRALGVAADNMGSVYLAGHTYYNPLDLGSTNRNLLLIKFDSDGTAIWDRIMVTSGDTGANGVATDNSGNVYVVGYTYDSLDGNPNAGMSDLFILKFSGGGNLLWSRQLGTTGYDEAQGVSVDNAGNIYVAGFTSGGLDGNPNAGGYDFFIIKYDTGGNRIWTRQFGTQQGDFANGVATDDNGNVFVTGYTYGGMDGNVSAGERDIFLVKYDGSGNRIWTRQIGSPSVDYASSVATDGVNIYVGGQTFGDLDGNRNMGVADLVLVKYDNMGNKQWTRQAGGGNNDLASGVAADRTGNVYAAGETGIGMNDTDVLLIKYDSAGNR